MSRLLVSGLIGCLFLAIMACGSGAAPAPESRREAVPREVVVEREVIKEVPREVVVEKEVAKEITLAKKDSASAMVAPAATTIPAAPARDDRGGQGQPSATTFRDYGRLPFVDTAEDNVSTFSLDTDRTSYQLALTWARSGYEVAPDSVRAEEWVNAFNYDYSPPDDGGSFAISTDVFRHPLDDRKHMARIGFQAPELLDATPLNVTLVLDASGSMSDGNRVAIAREAAESIRSSLSDRDRIAVVHFTTDVIRDLTVKHRRTDDYDVKRSISRLKPHNSTNVQAGLDLGVELAERVRRERPDAYNYIILMSDGVANVDATNPFAILRSAYDPDSGNPLRIITVGVGIENYNDHLLEQLAQHGNGWYRYLDDTDQAKATFSRDNWLALSTPFADQTRAQVTWNPNVVRSWRIVGYENRVTPDETFTQDRKEFAEIFSGAATTVFYELELHGGARRAGATELGDVELRWADPVTGKSWRQRSVVSGRPDVDFGRLNDSLLQFGAIVALASDRYSGLPYDRPYPSDDLDALQDRLQDLQRDLGRLDSYKDFRFLLEHITEDAGSMAPQDRRGSGYSR